MKKLLPILFLITSLNTSAGYIGDLPDLSGAFKEEQQKYKQEHGQKQIESRPFIDMQKDEAQKIMPAPNSEKYNDYLLESNPNADYLVEIIKLQKPLDELLKAAKGDDIQLFAAKAYFFNLKANQFLNKYKNKNRQNSPSYQIVKELIRQNNQILALWQKSDYALQYVSYSSAGGAYTKETIEKNLSMLQKNIEIVQEEIRLLSE